VNQRGIASPTTHSAAPTLDLACELIARKSPTPDDGGCQDILRARLEPLGFRCETIESNGVTNLWARRGEAHPIVCFAGHTDVVPTGRSSPGIPIPSYRHGATATRRPRRRRHEVFDRGVRGCGQRLLPPRTTRNPGSIALITSDEEGPATDGTIRVVDSPRRRRRSTIASSEPSSVDRLGDMIKNGRRGTLSGALIVRGVQGHIAYPQLAKNPIHIVAPAIAELAAMRWDEGDEHFPPTTWQVSNIHAGTGATNEIPGTLELAFNFRYATVSGRDTLEQRLEAVLRKHRIEYDLRWTGWGRPFITPRGRLVETVSEVVRDICAITPELSCTGGTSDGRFIADICREVVELGPVNASIHKLNERVAIADLEPLAEIYRRILEKLLAP
jgi:succinyl-diaminopimelate desuccinylase